MIPVRALPAPIIRRMHHATDGELGRFIIDLENARLSAHVATFQDAVDAEGAHWTILVVGRTEERAAQRWRKWNLHRPFPTTLASLVYVHTQAFVADAHDHQRWVRAVLDAIHNGEPPPSSSKLDS